MESRTPRRTLALIVTLAAVSVDARAETIAVPDPGNGILTIQDGVDAADPGDTVLVGAGKYVESVLVAKQDLTILGQHAVVDAEYGLANEIGVPSPCFFVRADGVTISGFTLLNGTDGVYVLRDRVRIEGNVIRAAQRDGVHVDAVNALVISNEILGCGRHGISINEIDCCRADGCEKPCDGVDGEPRFEPSGTSRTVVSRNLVSQCSGLGVLVRDVSLSIVGNTVRTNGQGGISAHAGGLEIDGDLPSSAIRRNVLDGNGGDGLSATHSSLGEVHIERNRAVSNGGHGIRMVGYQLIAERNAADRNRKDGLRCEGLDNALIENSAVANGLVGIHCTIPTLPLDSGIATRSVELDGLSTFIVGNRSRGNGRDGIRAHTRPFIITGNTVSSNCGDGLDVDDSDFVSPTAPPNVIARNTVERNAHEGIDNSSKGALIDDNKCLFNNGADMAAKGTGVGSAASFSGNLFSTGGQFTKQKLELFWGS